MGASMAGFVWGRHRPERGGLRTTRSTTNLRTSRRAVHGSGGIQGVSSYGLEHTEVLPSAIRFLFNRGEKGAPSRNGKGYQNPSHAVIICMSDALRTSPNVTLGVAM